MNTSFETVGTETLLQKAYSGADFVTGQSRPRVSHRFCPPLDYVHSVYVLSALSFSFSAANSPLLVFSYDVLALSSQLSASSQEST